MRIDGMWLTRTVRVDGRNLSPKRSQRVWNHSPDGFNWGYAGSGPAQLALAILLKAGVERDEAVRFHQAFKFAFIATLPQADFSIECDPIAWVAQQRAVRL